MAVKTMQVTAPAPWACALVYGDFSGIEDNAECERVEAFMDSLPGHVVDVAGEPEFRRSFGTDTPGELAGDFVTYTVLVHRGENND